MVESQVKEQRLAGDWLEVRREGDQVGMLSDQSRVDAESFQMLTERLCGGAARRRGKEKESLDCEKTDV